MILSDKKLFAIVLYSAFVKNKFLIPNRDIWENAWVIGISGAIALGLVGALIAPFILSAIIEALGFGVEGIAAESFASWFMSLYEGTIVRGSLVSILQSIGAAGLGTLGTTISSGFGAAIGTLIGAIGGSKLASYLREMDLNETEKQMLGSFIKIEESVYQNNDIIMIFTLMPALLYNDTILKCFSETFISCSPFANSKLFRFNFKENKLKSEEERVNNTVYNLLIDNCNKSRIEYIFHDDYLVGYNLNLIDYKPSNLMTNLLVEVWNIINGNIIINIPDIDKIRDQINDQIHKIDINKFNSKISEQVSEKANEISKFFNEIHFK
ncbi:unnamed protein product [Rhizophagus irregularis]|uniref:Uncharacterized protein n=1 Tax=Rhizophagus irregularis TaxID=588596 RepID=A0A2N1NZ61_9GLOM|nr:hypothetical protein RhiirC2_727890 [Rhizophagus irregularis]CAB4377166.1 unnamed protein product [Rhizophagus irregularis]CAB5394272.1 unnamed protein product [Rhizophagus irregularis]